MMALRDRKPQTDAPALCERCGETIEPRKRRRGASLCRVCAARASQAFLEQALVHRSHRGAA